MTPTILLHSHRAVPLTAAMHTAGLTDEQGDPLTEKAVDDRIQLVKEALDVAWGYEPNLDHDGDWSAVEYDVLVSFGHDVSELG